MERKEEILRLFSIKIRTILKEAKLDYEKLQEIRLRVGKPLLLLYQNREYFINEKGQLLNDGEEAYCMTQNEIRETMEYISNYSLYAFEEELRQGFITVKGGHRVGIAGRIILEDEKIKAMKYISFLNIRFAHEKKGCADMVIPYIWNMEKEHEIYHTLFISPPGCGKTTLLRDTIRQLSNGTRKRKGLKVGVVDERSELGACYMGIPQNDLGIRTDLLDCCPKAKGMMMLIRSMSPEVIAVDEIGSKEDVKALEQAMYCGCKLIGTVHGSSVRDLEEKPVLKELLKKRIFKRFIILEKKEQVGTIQGIYNEKGVRLN
ncbi:stage III sporulation protein AA [Velocimicrobium porci]|uniref:Stage III sporulation protein AA n=1 Tax=Velocimicrobium porci TaxID=2606634 RepID=A0A6L5XZ49_9FIRM|nr:stage III sporulation protein AA [Velocimicrobium porci]MSS63741.1 stage III sporulation protein AA [Velocimicrobium porci]